MYGTRLSGPNIEKSLFYLSSLPLHHHINISSNKRSYRQLAKAFLQIFPATFIAMDMASFLLTSFRAADGSSRLHSKCMNMPHLMLDMMAGATSIHMSLGTVILSARPYIE